MKRTTRNTRTRSQREERIPLHARLQLRTLDGKPVAPLGRCTNISLGGLRVTAAEGVSPGTPVEIELKLPTGSTFHARGRVAWSMMTLHPSLFGSPTGRDDDARFGVAFDEESKRDLLPIARLLVARQDEKRRARRIRRLHVMRIHA